MEERSAPVTRAGSGGATPRLRVIRYKIVHLTHE